VETEVAEFVERLAEGFAGGDCPPFEGVEEFVGFGGWLAEWEIGVGADFVLVDVLVELDLGAVDAAEDPLAIDDVVDDGALFGAGGLEVVVVLGDE